MSRTVLLLFGFTCPSAPARADVALFNALFIIEHCTVPLIIYSLKSISFCNKTSRLRQEVYLAIKPFVFHRGVDGRHLHIFCSHPHIACNARGHACRILRRKYGMLLHKLVNKHAQFLNRALII